MLRKHLRPTFGDTALRDIEEADVRRWGKARLDAGVGLVTVAKAYRLMRAIFNTAVHEDEIVRRNPCRIEGAGREESQEREVVPLPKVFEIVGVVPTRYRALVLLATFAGLRWGELVGLRRRDLDLDACVVRVENPLVELDGGKLQPESPKSRAGRRAVAIPEEIVPELRWHL